MNELEKKIDELSTRVERLEKIEKRRTIFKIIGTVIAIILIIIFIIMSYKLINDIEPYMDIINENL